MQVSGGHFFTAFWAWHDLASFLLALAGFTLFWSIVTSILIKVVYEEQFDPSFRKIEILKSKFSTNSSSLYYSNLSPCIYRWLFFFLFLHFS